MNAFWRGRRVFLTGHTGFKGGWLALWLQRLGAEVTGFALRPDDSPALYEEAGIASVCRSLIGDVRDEEVLWRAMSDARPEIVFHLAAQPLVRASYRDPQGTMQTNVMGTVNVLEGVRRIAPVHAAVVVTSDKCYANDNSARPFVEDDALGGHDPYSASKACAEIVTAAYRASFLGEAGIPVATARAGNVIGGGDWAQDRLVPDLVRARMRGDQVELRYPDAVRPWQHVLEPLYGYLELARRLAEGGCPGEAYNFGPDSGEVHSVADIANAFCSEWSGSLAWRAAESAQAAEQHVLVLDAAKATRDLAVRSRLGFEQTCRWTAEWYRRWQSGESARALCEEQLERYEALL